MKIIVMTLILTLPLTTFAIDDSQTFRILRSNLRGPPIAGDNSETIASIASQDSISPILPNGSSKYSIVIHTTKSKIPIYISYPTKEKRDSNLILFRQPSDIALRINGTANLIGNKYIVDSENVQLEPSRPSDTVGLVAFATRQLSPRRSGAGGSHQSQVGLLADTAAAPSSGNSTSDAPDANADVSK